MGVGRLHAVHAGVYAVGHPVLAPGRPWLAAVLACGRRPALGDATAAFEWSVRRGEPRLIEIVVGYPILDYATIASAIASWSTRSSRPRSRS